jgi:hypothetical protein
MQSILDAMMMCAKDLKKKKKMKIYKSLDGLYVIERIRASKFMADIKDQGYLDNSSDD